MKIQTIKIENARREVSRTASTISHGSNYNSLECPLGQGWHFSKDFLSACLERKGEVDKDEYLLNKGDN